MLAIPLGPLDFLGIEFSEACACLAFWQSTTCCTYICVRLLLPGIRFIRHMILLWLRAGSWFWGSGPEIEAITAPNSSLRLKNIPADPNQRDLARDWSSHFSDSDLHLDPVRCW